MEAADAGAISEEGGEKLEDKVGETSLSRSSVFGASSLLLAKDVPPLLAGFTAT